MSISEDIKALEGALAEHDRVHSCGTWSEGVAGSGANLVAFCGDDITSVAHVASPARRDYMAAACPDRIRRVLAKLEFERGHRQMIEKAYEAQSARLSKAIELLEETRDFYADTPLKREINAFLSLDSQK